MNQAIDWSAATNETVQNLSQLIKIDTTNPPGNELPAILLIKEILERDGFTDQDFTIVESAPGRANLVIRLRGDGSKRPFLLSGHVDVVAVEREHWSRDPFCGEVLDGVVWGRGALDMKGSLAMYLQTFLLAHRQGLPLKRDLILAAIADEENGFVHGSKFLVDEHRELIDAEYAFTESGGITTYLGSTRLYPIQVAEKGICWLCMRGKGDPGHGSVPYGDNAVFHLAQALERLRKAGHLTIQVTPIMRAMLESAARQVGFPAKLAISLLRFPAFVRLFLHLIPPEYRPMTLVLFSNTVSPTVLRAGTKTNVIPSLAEAELDCRTLPGQTPEDVMREIAAIVGDRVTLEPKLASMGTSFSPDTELYRLIERKIKELDPQGIVVPMTLFGSTDASQYQRAGITVYGFTPGVLPPEFPLLELTHGHDERLPISFIETGLPRLWEVVSHFCTQ